MSGKDKTIRELIQKVFIQLITVSEKEKNDNRSRGNDTV